MSLSLPELERFVAGLVASPQRWRHLVRHADDVRVYEQIWDDADVNAWVICWSQDQDTGFHDHDESGAAIAVVAGRVREDRLSSAVKIHAYSPPLRRTGAYRVGPGGQLERESQPFEVELRGGPAAV